MRSFAARALRMRGYNVLEASGGEEALEIVKNDADKIDLIITDVVMPNMDGPTMVRHVKALKPDLAVIFMSGYAEEAFRRNDEKFGRHSLPAQAVRPQAIGGQGEGSAGGRRLEAEPRKARLQSPRFTLCSRPMKKPLPLIFCLLLAGCTDADWDHALNYTGLEGSAEESEAAAAQPAPDPVSAPPAEPRCAGTRQHGFLPLRGDAGCRRQRLRPGDAAARLCAQLCAVHA